MQQQFLRHEQDPRAIRWSRAAAILAVVALAAWLAWFAGAPPWDAGGRHMDASEFFGRLAGLLVVLAAIFSPLVIAAVGARRRR